MNSLTTRLLRISTWCLTIALLASCGQSSEEQLDFEKEKAKIIDVIAKETESYYKQDFEGWKSNFLQSPEFRQYSYWDGWTEKVKFYNGFAALEADKKKQFEEDRTIWKGSRETRENENFRITRDMAWYTFEQLSFEAGTDKFLGKSLETRILEKVNGEWKIAYLGYHYFPKDTVGVQ